MEPVADTGSPALSVFT